MTPRLPCGNTASLTAADRDTIARARTVAALTGPAIRAHTGERDAGLALASALGEAQHLLAELAGIAERLGGEE